ncbi:unnamed protein product [Ectocarpus fasciculatus]
MVIETTSSSVSPRPRRASAPVPPTSLLPFKPLMAGEKRQERERGAAGGPTLDQCLVLPSGVALKIDGLLSTSGAAREHGVGIGNSDGAGGADADRGGGDDDRGNGSSNSLGKDGAGIACPLPGEGDDDDGGDRAIISSFDFNTSGSQAVIGVVARECLEEKVEQAAASCDESPTVETPDAPETTPGKSKRPPVGALAQEEALPCVSDRGYSRSNDSRNDASDNGNGITKCDETYESHHVVEGDEPLRPEPPDGQPSSPATGDVCGSSMVCDEEGTTAMAAAVTIGIDADRSASSTGSCKSHHRVEGDEPPSQASSGGQPLPPETGGVCSSLMVVDKEKPAATTAVASGNEAHNDSTNSDDSCDGHRRIHRDKAQRPEPPGEQPSSPETEVCVSSTVCDEEESAAALAAATAAGAIDDTLTAFVGSDKGETLVDPEAVSESPSVCDAAAGSSTIVDHDGQVRTVKDMESNNACISERAPCLRGEIGAETNGTTETERGGNSRETSGAGEEPHLPGVAGRSFLKAETGEASTVLATGETSAVGELNAGASGGERFEAVGVNERDAHVRGEAAAAGVVTPSPSGDTCGEGSAREGTGVQGGDPAAGNVGDSEVEVAFVVVDDDALPKARGEYKGESSQEDMSEYRAGHGNGNGATVAVEAREGFTGGRASDEQVLEAATSVADEGARGVWEKAVADEGVGGGVEFESSRAENQERETEKKQGGGQNEEGNAAEHGTIDEENLAAGSRMDDVMSAVSPGLPSNDEGDVEGGEEEKSKEEKEGSNEGTGGEKVEHGNSIVVNETLVEEARAGLSSPASDGLANTASVGPAADINDGFVSSFTEVRLDNSAAALDVAPAKTDGTTPPVDWDILAKNQEEEVEVPLDWEALAREVEAEWVLEGSGDESELSFSAASQPVNPPSSPAKATEASVQNSGDEPALAAAEERPPSLDSVGLVDSSSAHGSSQPERQQEVEVEGEPEMRAGGDEGEPPESALPTATPPDPRRNHDDGGSGGSSGVAVTPASDANFRQDTKEASEDSDCGSPLSLTDGQVSSIAGLPAAEATSPTPALAGHCFVTPTRAKVGAPQHSLSASPARSQQAQRATSTAPEEDGGACSPAKADPPPSPSNAPRGPKSEAAAESNDASGCENSGHQDAHAAVPVTRIPPVDDGHDGGAGPPEATERNGWGDSGVSCAQGSCGCVLM